MNFLLDKRPILKKADIHVNGFDLSGERHLNPTK